MEYITSEHFAYTLFTHSGHKIYKFFFLLPDNLISPIETYQFYFCLPMWSESYVFIHVIKLRNSFLRLRKQETTLTSGLSYSRSLMLSLIHFCFFLTFFFQQKWYFRIHSASIFISGYVTFKTSYLIFTFDHAFQYEWVNQIFKFISYLFFFLPMLKIMRHLNDQIKSG